MKKKASRKRQENQVKAFLAKVFERSGRFFVPAPGSPRWMYVLPFIAVIGLVLLIFVSGTFIWDYTNSSTFCGTACHLMPPQDVTYKISPHANVYCTECHIGRAFIGEQLGRKTEDVRELFAMIFHTYKLPIQATRSKPARETCEKCHHPETLSNDSLRTITKYSDNEKNDARSTYLILKTGGGAKREGLGRGIHWHIVNKVEFVATDELEQNIPYVLVTNDDETKTGYINPESGIDPSKIAQKQLKEMDCVTCHNRITHDFKTPVDSVDESMARGLISPSLPFIHKEAVAVLGASYDSSEDGLSAINALEAEYEKKIPGLKTQVSAAFEEIRRIYARSVFPELKISSSSHPNNIGHMNSAGCFRCHDGKHLSGDKKAIRLECNICHSIPVVSTAKAPAISLEITKAGLEPQSHLNQLWIKEHYRSMDNTCVKCHTTDDPGGASNTSFCSNSACHGNVYPFAGIDAAKMLSGNKEVKRLVSRFKSLSRPAITKTVIKPVMAFATYNAGIGPMLANNCGGCHDAGGSGGLDVTTYRSLLKGGDSGTAVTPGNPSGSIIVKKQAEEHYANLSQADLDALIKWIASGAPEK